jgi:hypothetical protein
VNLKNTVNLDAVFLIAVLGIIYCITLDTELLDDHLKQVLTPMSQSQPTYPWPSLFLETELVTNRKEMQRLYTNDCITLSAKNALAVQRSKASIRVATFNLFAFRGVLSTQSTARIAVPN